jgi:hypothetical protein
LPQLVAHQFTVDISDSATTLDITAARAFSKISSVWVTFTGAGNYMSYQFWKPFQSPGALDSEPDLFDGPPEWSLTSRLSVGGKFIPDPAPMDSFAQHYYYMVKALGYSPNVSREEFLGAPFCVVFDTKRVPHDHGTGLSSRSGDIIRIELKNMDPGIVKTAHVTMWAYSVVTVRESQVSLLN